MPDSLPSCTTEQLIAKLQEPGFLALVEALFDRAYYAVDVYDKDDLIAWFYAIRRGDKRALHELAYAAPEARAARKRETDVRAL